MRRQGFTLIELLVTVGILSILITSLIVVVNPSSQIQKANDAKRKADFSQLQKALDVYYADFNRYPDAVSGKIQELSWGNSWPSSPPYYMTKLPKDPRSDQDYRYESDGSSYRLYAKLERCSDSQNTIGVDCSSPYNYSVSSSNLAMIPTATPIPTPTPIPSPTPTPTPLPVKKVFVTSTAYNGDIKTAGSGSDGLDGADKLCQSRAITAGLSGTYKAWLGSSSVSTSSRLIHSTGYYKLINGTIIANNWTDLTDGSIAHAINIDENGGSVPSGTGCSTNKIAWTNTNSDGSLSYSSFASLKICGDWTSIKSSANGRVGQINSVDSNWSTSCANSCDLQARLYCLEQ